MIGSSYPRIWGIKGKPWLFHSFPLSFPQGGTKHRGKAQYVQPCPVLQEPWGTWH